MSGIDRKFIGHESAPVTLEVERGHIRRFAEAIGDDNPIYRDEAAARAAGYPGIPAPPTFATALRPNDAREGIDIDWKRLLHGEQQYRYQRPLIAGDRLVLVQRIKDIYEKQGRAGTMDFIVMETTAHDPAGQLVYTAVLTAVIKHGPPGRSRGWVAMMPRFQDLTVGMALPKLVKRPIERIQLVQYAGASGDFNRIHVEEGFATSAGYKSVFAHGMLSMGFLGQLVTDWAGGPGPIRTLSVRFKAITWPDDVITVTGEIAALDPTTRTATVKLAAQNQAGEVTCEGSAEVEVDRP